VATLQGAIFGEKGEMMTAKALMRKDSRDGGEERDGRDGENFHTISTLGRRPRSDARMP